MEALGTSYALGSQDNSAPGAVKVAAAQLKVVQDAVEQKAASVVKLVEETTESNPSAKEGAKGGYISVKA